MKIYDLTQLWSASTPPWPYFPDPRVEAFHRIPATGIYSLIVKTSMHTGTHIDAPLHFSATGWDMAQVPLDRLIGTGLVVDMTKCAQDYALITPQMIESQSPEKICKGDILILHYGWQRYCWTGEERDEERYFCRHPGPTLEFSDWMMDLDLKWVGVDTGSFEHPMNCAVRDFRPDLVKEFEEKIGQPLEKVFPKEKVLLNHKRTLGNNQMHAENVGGQVGEVAGKRLLIGAFPWRFQHGDASICRILAFEDFGK